MFNIKLREDIWIFHKASLKILGEIILRVFGDRKHLTRVSTCYKCSLYSSGIFEWFAVLGVPCWEPFNTFNCLNIDWVFLSSQQSEHRRWHRFHVNLEEKWEKSSVKCWKIHFLCKWSEEMSKIEREKKWVNSLLRQRKSLIN